MIRNGSSSSDERFLMITESTPFFLEVYTQVRLYEKQKGTWTEEDELDWQAAMSSAFEVEGEMVVSGERE